MHFFNQAFDKRGWSNISKFSITYIIKEVAVKTYFASSNVVTLPLLTDLTVCPSQVTACRCRISPHLAVLFYFLYFAFFNFSGLLVVTAGITTHSIIVLL